MFFEKKVKIFNSNKIVAKYVKNFLENHNMLNDKKTKKEHEFYVSNYTQSFEKCAKLFFKNDINLQQHKIK